LTALAKGARFKIVGSSVRRGAVQYFVVHPRFGDWQDLLGSNLGALSRGSCSDWYMREVLAHHAIDPDNDVTIISLGPRYPQILRLLADGPTIMCWRKSQISWPQCCAAAGEAIAMPRKTGLNGLNSALDILVSSMTR
jgi:hypothetical protein